MLTEDSARCRPLLQNISRGTPQCPTIQRYVPAWHYLSQLYRDI